VSITVREHLAASSLAEPITINLGAGTAVADVVVALHFTAFYPAADMIAPTGGGTWQGPIVIARNDGTNSPHIKAWWLPVTTGGAQAIDFNHNQADPPHNVVVAVLIGADTVNPVSDSDVLNDAFGTAQVAPSVDGEAGGVLLCGWVSDDLVTYTAPGTMTGLETDNGFNDAMGAYELLVSGGATGTRTATSSAGKTHTAVSVAIRAAGGAAGPANVGLASTSVHPGRGPSRFARFVQRSLSTEVVAGGIEQALDGQASVAVDASGSVSVERPIASSANAASSATGTASVERPVEGTGSAASSASATLLRGRAMDASAPVAASASATLTRAAGLASHADVAASATGSAQAARALSGVTPVAASATGSVDAARSLSASAGAASSASGDISIQGQVTLAGSADVASGASAGLSRSVPLSAVASAAADASGALSVRDTTPALEGSADVVSSAVSPGVEVLRGLAVSASVAASAVASLSVAAPYVPAYVSVEGTVSVSADLDQGHAELVGVPTGSTVASGLVG
jgi:hypothetical protein